MLKGRTAFITGTNRGIGKALVAEFARNGADVIAHARRETPEFLSMLEEIASKYSVKVSPLFFDMTNSEAMKTAVRGLISSRIPVDILVNNAGVAHGGLFQMTGMSKVREVFDSDHDERGHKRSDDEPDGKGSSHFATFGLYSF